MADSAYRHSDDTDHDDDRKVDLKRNGRNLPEVYTVTARPEPTPNLCATAFHSIRNLSRSPSNIRHQTCNDAMDDKQILQNTLGEEKTFEVTFEEDDSMNPKNLSVARKWVIVLLVTSASLCVTVTASLYTSTYDQMNAELDSTRILATLGLTTYALGLGLGPMLVGPLSEFYGRRPIYLVSLSFFVVWLIPCAVAHNIQTVIIARFLGGFAGSAFLSVAGGTVGDLFTKDKLQQPMLVFTAAPLMGPSSGPLLGGFINYNLNWRWSFYILLMWAGAQTLAVAVAVPETYAPVILRSKARKIRKETGDDRYKATIEVIEKSIFRTVVRSLYRPFLLLTLDPMCLSLCLLSALLLGILYLFFGAFNVVFREVYDFNLWQVGCSFLGILVGMLFAVASDPIWHRIYNRLLDKTERETGERTSEPEFRLPSAIFGAWFCVIGMFWFAWTTLRSVHWIVPIIGTAFFGCGVLLVFEGIFTFLVEAFPLYAASALAANSFMRNISSGAFPLFGVQMYHTLGFNWASTLLGFLTLIMAPFPYIFYRYGKRLRAKSKFGSA